MSTFSVIKNLELLKIEGEQASVRRT